MTNQKKASKALQLLAQIIPKYVLERARDLFLQEEQEDRIKRFMGRNILFLIVSFLGIAFFGGAAVSTLLRVVMHIAAVHVDWAKYLAVPFALLGWLGVVLYYMHKLLGMMRLAALAEPPQIKDESASRKSE